MFPGRIFCLSVMEKTTNSTDIYNFSEQLTQMSHTVEPRYNEHQYNKVLGMINDLLYTSNSKIPYLFDYKPSDFYTN